MEGSDERDELAALQLRLESKIKIISPAIDMIELIAARGNTSLDSAVTLTKSIRYEIQSLGLRLSKAVESETVTSGSKAQKESGLKRIVRDIKQLLNQIEDAVPLISLAITTSGVNLSTALPSTVSPSRLLQASTFLSAGDSQYASCPGGAVQIGSVFVLSLYMLFGGHSLRAQDVDGVRETTWKEVIHKARVKLLRVPLSGLFNLPNSTNPDLSKSTGSSHTLGSEDYFKQSIPSDAAAHEFGYQLLIVEDLDDGRFHSDDGESPPGPFDDVTKAGIREVIPIHEVSKIFYADTGKILDIGAEGEPNNPILLLKRDPNSVPPRRMMEVNHDAYDDLPSSPTTSNAVDSPRPKVSPGKEKQPWRFPADLDPEWFAFEVFTETPDSDDEDEVPDDEVGSSPPKPMSETASIKAVTGTFSSLRLDSSPISRRHSTPNKVKKTSSGPSLSIPSPNLPVSDSPQHGVTLPALRTSLSLLELLIRLTALQQFQQCSHLAINDELLNFFLAESSSTGAGLDSDRRRMLRANASQRIGFDPYAESPIKIRGEDDVYEHQRQASDDLGDYDARRQPHFSSPVNYGPTSDDLAVSNRAYRRGGEFGTPSGSSPAWRERETYAASPSPGVRQQEWPPRIAALRGERLGRKGRLERSESDSTLGTSPMSEADQRVRPK